MFCYKCGTQSREGAVFCRNCGVKLMYVNAESQMQDVSASVVSEFDTCNIDSSIPEETREDYDMLVRSSVPRPKCIRKIRPKKAGLVITGYVHEYVLPPRGADLFGFNVFSFIALGWFTALITGMRDDMRCSLSGLGCFFLVLSFLPSLFLGLPILSSGNYSEAFIFFLITLIMFLFLNIYAYKEEKEIMTYINEALNRDEAMPSMTRYFAIAMICVTGFIIMASMISD